MSQRGAYHHPPTSTTQRIDISVDGKMSAARESRMFSLDSESQIGLRKVSVSATYSPDAVATLRLGDCREFLRTLPDAEAALVATSPPYNLGKAYETRRPIEDYLREQEEVVRESVRVLSPRGSLCWQVGNHVAGGEVYPLDLLLYPIFKKFGLRLRNRIVWTFGHGLHCSRRFSGRYETILWFTKGEDYTFNLDAVRTPSKYPGKRYFKGPKKGQLSGNPLGKNPTDVWEIPNVKFNHVEKTVHPCQFPVELVERLVLSLTNEGDLVVDPFMGVGSALVAAVLRRRRGAGADIVPEYVRVAKDRVVQALEGRIRTRPMGRPVYQPPKVVEVAKPLETRRILTGLTGRLD
jgi:adenine-specific DNA-methyltransferase